MAHEGAKPYACDKCDASFSRKNNLKWHKFTHSGEYKCKCTKCPATFMRPRDLKKHLLTHLPPKTYFCEECQISLLTCNAFKRHMMIHSGQSPHECPKCSQSFVEKSALKRHMYKHESPKSYECKLCDTQFRDLRSLRKHTVQFHGEDHTKDKQPLVSSTEGPPNNSVYLTENTSNIQQLQLHQPQTLTNVELAVTQQQAVIEPHSQPMQQISLASIPQTNMSTSTAFVTQPFAITNKVADVNQLPSILISTTPGQPPRQAKPANDCPNHSSHVFTYIGNNQLQSWCFCDDRNEVTHVIGNTIQSPPEGVISSHPVVAVSPNDIQQIESSSHDGQLIIDTPQDTRNAFVTTIKPQSVLQGQTIQLQYPIQASTITQAQWMQQ